MDAFITPIRDSIVMQCDVSDLAVETRRRMFNILLRDPKVVTVVVGTPEHEKFIEAVQAACDWSK